MVRTLQEIIDAEKPDVLAEVMRKYAQLDLYDRYRASDIELIKAYDSGEFTYCDMMRFCMKSARKLAFGWN